MCNRDDILQRLSSEEFLLDVMNYSFACGDIDIKEGIDFSQLVDKLLDGIVELEEY